MKIYCTGCGMEVDARLTSGTEMYPTRPDLRDIPFWVCDTCRSFVGTHHKTKKWRKPLGHLATSEIKQWRMRIHQILDPLWKKGLIQRGNAYRRISVALGYDYHTGNIYSVEEARRIYEIVKGIKNQLDPHNSPWNQ